ncbi:MAG: hypothetical protein PVH43_04735, partial [Desulfobacterales bacterium]
NLLKRRIVQIEETQHVQPGEKQRKPLAKQKQSNLHHCQTGSVWIDPRTHFIIRRETTHKEKQSNSIYAVGAMTRGQIIDASMARGIVQSTAAIAERLIRYLKNPRTNG